MEICMITGLLQASKVRHHQRNNDGGDGTGSLGSRHARDERSTRPRKSQRDTYSDDKEPRKPPQRHHRRPSSSEMTTSKRSKDGIDIIIDDKTIIIFQNGASAHITMSDLPQVMKEMTRFAMIEQLPEG